MFTGPSPGERESWLGELGKEDEGQPRLFLTS